MAPRKPKAPQLPDEQEIYIRWAQAFLLCRDEVIAARGVGIAPEHVDQFIQMTKYSVEAQKIIAEDCVFVPDFNNTTDLRTAILKQLWKEARSSGLATAASARVSALRAISDIAGISNPEDSPKGAQAGGMLFVPVMSMDKWEKACEKAQAALRAEVHE